MGVYDWLVAAGAAAAFFLGLLASRVRGRVEPCLLVPGVVAADAALVSTLRSGAASFEDFAALFAAFLLNAVVGVFYGVYLIPWVSRKVKGAVG